ncbi:hypothetical protein [Modestobacter versicolor]|uniref:hypothetical protein n=1 Tax=Modestobacter versicolor TaxID=429133 RepID=UPI0034E00B4C
MAIFALGATADMAIFASGVTAGARVIAERSEVDHSSGVQEVKHPWPPPPPSGESVGNLSDTPCDPMEYLSLCLV